MSHYSEATIFLDWLRFSVPLEIKNCELLPPHEIFDASGEVLTPLKNYKQCVALIAGRIDWNEDSPRQRKLVTLTGDDLLTMRRAGVSDDMLLMWVAAFEDLNVTRMDIAFDTRHKSITPHNLYRAWQGGGIQTTARTVTRVQGTTSEYEQSGYTVYVGSRQSEQFLRIYDKRAEQLSKGKEVALPEQLWTRAELELKGDKAHVALRTLAQEKIKNGGVLIGRFVSWPANTTWGDICKGHIVSDLSVGRKETDHETWLRRVVFPNFEKALRAGNPRARQIVEAWRD